MRPAAVPPAMSTCDMIQPPKMSPFWFASAGIGMTRNAGCLPSGSFSIVKRSATEGGESASENESGIREVGVRHDALGDRGLGLVEIRRDQLVDELLVIGVGLSLRGLAADPSVDA